MNNVNASQYFVFQKWGSKCQVACGRLGLRAALVLKTEALPISCPLTRLRYCCLVCAYSMNWISICPVLSGACDGGGLNGRGLNIHPWCVHTGYLGFPCSFTFPSTRWEVTAHREGRTAGIVCRLQTSAAIHPVSAFGFTSWTGFHTAD